MNKKITAAILSATMIISTGAALAEENVTLISENSSVVEIQQNQKYIQYRITVKEATETTIVADVDGVDTTFNITDDTLFISKTKDLPKEGESFVILVDANSPAPAVYPPVYTAFAAIRTDASVYAGTLTKADEETLSFEDNSMKLVTGETGFEVDDLDGKDVIVVYSQTTFSLPAIAVAERIVTLDEEAVEEEVEEEEIVEEAIDYSYTNPYIIYDITVKNVTDEGIVAEYEGGEATFATTENTIFNSKTKDMPKEGDAMKVVIDGRLPMTLQEPPVYTVAALIRADENVYAGEFDEENGMLVSKDKTLALNLEGTDYDMEALDDNDLVVVYGISTRSIPAQTTPTQVIVLNDNNADFEEYLKEEADKKKNANNCCIDIYVDRIKIDFSKYSNVEPIIEDDFTLVPLRAIAEALGCLVEYDDTQKLVTISNDKIKVELTLNADKANVNGEEKQLQKEAKVVDGRTLVPARFVSEAMGHDVDWDQASLSVIVD